jgi:hypothetical protein
MSLADKAKLLLIPSGYKTGKVYSVFPTDGDGDFTFSRTGEATRINPGGLIETVATQVPRIDHSGGGCPSLLLEPQRINYVPNQNVNSYGQNLADVTLSNNPSPDGTINCFRVEGTSSGLRVGIATFNVVIGNTYTGSVYVRKVSGSNIAQIVDVDFAAPQTININTEWQRFDITRTATQTTGRIFINVNQIGDVIEVFGFQIEQGTYSTSYIPTNGIIETRVGELCTDAMLNSPIITSDDWTLFFDVDCFAVKDNNNRIALNDGSTSNKIQLNYNGINDVFSLSTINNGVTINFQSIPTTERVKIAAISTLNGFDLYVNGVFIASKTNGRFDASTMTSIDFTQAGTSLPFEGKVYGLRYYDEPLTNAEAIELTTI